MLRRLYIRDFALIEELEVAFDTGLNIITGETGAGKSLVLGALSSIIGVYQFRAIKFVGTLIGWNG